MRMNPSILKLMPFAKLRLRRWGNITVIGMLALGAAACGTSTSSTTSKASSVSAVKGTGTSSATQRPLTVGTVTSINGSTITVQTTQFGPVSVVINSATVIHEIEKVSSSSMTVGDCVVATGKRVASGAAIAATTVAISRATPSNCAQGMGRPVGRSSKFPYNGGVGTHGNGGVGPHGNGGVGTHGPFSATSLSKAQREAIEKQLSNIEVAAGEVASINGNMVTLHLPKILHPSSSTSSQSSQSHSNTSATSATSATKPHFTTASSFTFGPQTVFTETLLATAGAIASGDCVTAFGPANTSGIVTAKTITVSAPSPSGCSSSFGHFSGFLAP